MKKLLYIVCFLFAISITTFGCREEKSADEKVEEALNDVSEELDEASDDVKDAAEDLKDEIEEVKEENSDGH